MMQKCCDGGEEESPLLRDVRGAKVGYGSAEPKLVVGGTFTLCQPKLHHLISNRTPQKVIWRACQFYIPVPFLVLYTHLSYDEAVESFASYKQKLLARTQGGS